jgi:hypothetical protein
VKHAALISLLFGAATAISYGLLGDFSDLLLGFWGTALLILVPVFYILSKLLRKIVPGTAGRFMAWQVLLYGILLPCFAGLDANHQSLYTNLCAVLLLGFIAWQLVSKWSLGKPTEASVS